MNIWRNAWLRLRLRTARSSLLRLFLSGSINCPVDSPVAELEELYGVDGEIELQTNQSQDDNQRSSVAPLGLNTVKTANMIYTLTALWNGYQTIMA